MIVEQSPAQMLEEFHSHSNATEATNTKDLRLTLHLEEHEELVHELKSANVDRGKLARELADAVYIAYGTALAYDIDLDAALAEVHRANMSKMEAGVRRFDGKIVKHEGFIPPDMSKAING